jgi:hypothetical protein
MPRATAPSPSAGPTWSSSSMASTGKTHDIQCRKCFGFGHIEKECRTKHVMVVLEDGEYDSVSDFDDDTLALIAARDSANSDSDKDMEVMGAETVDQYKSLVAQRVLIVQLSKAKHDQCHNFFKQEELLMIELFGSSLMEEVVTIWLALTWWRSLLYPHDNDLIHITFNVLRALISSR